MLIHWGKKTVFVNRGYCSNFCLVCRDFRPCLFTSVGEVAHIQGIGVGDHKHRFYAGRCVRCHTVMAYNDQEGTFGFMDRPPTDHDDLTFCTHTSEEIDNRCATEERLQAGALTQTERDGLIGQLLTRLNYSWAFEYERGGGVSLAAIGAFGGAVLLAIAVVLWMDPPRVPSAGWWIVTVLITAFGALGLGYAVWFSATRKGRTLRRYIAPRLAAGLDPIRPTLPELERAWSETLDMRDKWNLARALKPDEVQDAIREMRVRGAPWLNK